MKRFTPRFSLCLLLFASYSVIPATGNGPASVEQLEGKVYYIAGNRLMIRQPEGGVVRTLVPAHADVTIDGRDRDATDLSHGMHVTIDARPVGKKMVAQSVTARSPK